MIRSFGGSTPQVHESAYVDPGATVIGATVIADVVLEEQSSVWPGTVLRGDLEAIRLRRGANVQDNAVCHSEPSDPTELGEWVTVGHGAVVHGATVEEHTLIGMNAVILDGATVGPYTIIAAGTVVREGQQIPGGVLVAGSPAEVRRELDTSSRWFEAGEGYAQLAALHAAEADASP